MPFLFVQLSKSSNSIYKINVLQGFIAAISPFNFTAIGGNLAGTPAIVGNVVLWKPASTAILACYGVYKIFQEAGVPDGNVSLILN